MSLKSCLLSKPPLVVFVISLFAFALTTLLLAVIVKQRNSIPNPDTFDWNTFFLKFSDLDICVEDINLSQPKIATEGNELISNGTTTSISLLVPFATSFLKEVKKSNKILLEGSVLMDHMDRGRLARYQGMRVNLTLDLTMDERDLSATTTDVCVAISGPAQLVADLNQSRTRPMTCNIPTELSQATVVSFNTFTKHHLPFNWCRNGTHLELVYNSNSEWVVFISVSDRNLIYLHLMCTSAFLFVLAATFVVCAIFRGVKRPITKNIGDERGAATLLAESD